MCTVLGFVFILLSRIEGATRPGWLHASLLLYISSFDYRLACACRREVDVAWCRSAARWYLPVSSRESHRHCRYCWCQTARHCRLIVILTPVLITRHPRSVCQLYTFLGVLQYISNREIITQSFICLKEQIKLAVKAQAQKGTKTAVDLQVSS